MAGQLCCWSSRSLVRLVTIPLPIPFLGDVAFLIGLAGLVHVAAAAPPP